MNNDLITSEIIHGALWGAVVGSVTGYLELGIVFGLIGGAFYMLVKQVGEPGTVTGKSDLMNKIGFGVLAGAALGLVTGYPGLGVMMGFFLGVFWRMATKVEEEKRETSTSFYGKI